MKRIRLVARLMGPISWLGKRNPRSLGAKGRIFRFARNFFSLPGMGSIRLSLSLCRLSGICFGSRLSQFFGIFLRSRALAFCWGILRAGIVFFYPFMRGLF